MYIFIRTSFWLLFKKIARYVTSALELHQKRLLSTFLQKDHSDSCTALLPSSKTTTIYPLQITLHRKSWSVCACGGEKVLMTPTAAAVSQLIHLFLHRLSSASHIFQAQPCPLWSWWWGPRSKVGHKIGVATDKIGVAAKNKPGVKTDAFLMLAIWTFSSLLWVDIILLSFQVFL